MHILLFLAVATVVVMLWARGALFACVFMTLPLAALGIASLVTIGQPGGAGAGAVGIIASVGLLAAVWAPRYLRRGL